MGRGRIFDIGEGEPAVWIAARVRGGKREGAL
jgi:hypothetical protein